MTRRVNSIHLSKFKRKSHGGHNRKKKKSASLSEPEPRVRFVQFTEPEYEKIVSRKSTNSGRNNVTDVQSRRPMPPRNEERKSIDPKISDGKTKSKLHSTGQAALETNKETRNLENTSKALQGMFFPMTPFDLNKRYQFVVNTEDNDTYLIKFHKGSVELVSCNHNSNTKQYHCQVKGQKHENIFSSEKDYETSMKRLLALDPDSWNSILALFEDASSGSSSAHKPLTYTTNTNISLLY